MIDRSKARMLLASWGRTWKRIQDEQDRLRAYEMQLAYSFPPRLDGMPHAKGQSNPVLSLVEHNEQAREEYEAEKERVTASIMSAIREKFMIDSLVDNLPAMQRKVIRLRYEAQFGYPYISSALMVCEQYVKKIEAAAVDRIGRKIFAKQGGK